MAELRKLASTDQTAAIVGAVLRLDGFFPEFRGEHLEKLFPRSGLYAYPPGHQLIVQGDVARDLFIVCRGRVAIRQEFGSAAAELAELGERSIIGEVALLRDAPRSASGVVSIESEIYRLAYEDVQYILKNNAELAAHLKSLAAERTR